MTSCSSLHLSLQPPTRDSTSRSPSGGRGRAADDAAAALEEAAAGVGSRSPFLRDVVSRGLASRPRFPRPSFLQDVLPEVLPEVLEVVAWATSSATDGTLGTRPWWPWTRAPCPCRRPCRRCANRRSPVAFLAPALLRTWRELRQLVHCRPVMRCCLGLLGVCSGLLLFFLISVFHYLFLYVE
jgi:hypothetical protein